MKMTNKSESLAFSVLNIASPNVRETTTSRFSRSSTGAGNLQKSLSLLEDTGTTPGSLFHTSGASKHTTRLSERSSLSRISDVMDFSRNVSFHGGREVSFFQTHTPGKSFLVGETSTVADCTVDVTTTSAALLAEDDPGLRASASLYKDFQEKLHNYPSEHEIFELLLEFEKLCSEQLVMLRKVVKKVVPSQNKFINTIRVLNLLEQERNSWRLVRTLYQDRLQTELINDPDMILMDTLGSPLSDRQIIDNLYERDSFIRQCQLVVDWLEQNHAEDFEDKHHNKVKFFSESGVAWENTLETLLNKQKRITDPSAIRLIDEMDPDAPIRQHSSLHDLDREDEDRLLKCMFAHVRAGQLDMAQQLAKNCGYVWLAAALDGWRLQHDPNYGKMIRDGVQIQPLEGNLNSRDVWKAVCWKAAEDVRLPVYERGMYAALSGNLKNLLPVCSTWEDDLWAYMRVLTDVYIEQEIRGSTQQEKTLEELPVLFWEQILTPEQIFQNLQASTLETVRQEAKSPHQVIQKYLILDDIDGLIEEMYEMVQAEPSPPHHLIRFMVHLVLFLRTVGRSSKEELCVTVIEAFVKVLIEEGQNSLVSTYAAHLPPLLQVAWYAKFLEGIKEPSERQHCLQLAENMGLDVPLITKTVVENIRSIGREPLKPLSELTSDTTEEDLQKVEAIDWLVFDPSQRAEAVKQANALMRVFVASKKLDAARKVFAKIPADSIDVIFRQWRRITGRTELSPEDDNATREYICFQAYLQAHDAFNDWFEHYHHGRPKEPKQPEKSDIKFTEWVAYEHQQKQYEADFERWEQALMAQTKDTVNRIYNVLLFVDGGWMVDQKLAELEKSQDEPEETGRLNQMSLLRKLCIPQMSFLLHTILHETKQFKEALQLADIIASEKNQLYKDFSKEELRTLFQKLRESSLVLLDQSHDPLGYPWE
ncbi:nuclear pore complex protein Nup107 isoform X3 [Tachypleus tridentatus]|uniref:nuclear pore complex protein Nup107 isoform X3 n=1 Tax=Tachypleus tridentatus TaxID=6853 RepID=UPI003FD119AF